MQMNSSQIIPILEDITLQSSSRLNATLDRRTSDLLIPNVELSVNLRLFRKRREQLVLAISSWFLGSVGYLVREELLENSRELLVKLACSNKATALEILIEKNSERDFFGNWIPFCKRILSALRLKLKFSKKPRRAVRRRGPQDHGSLRPDHKWLESSDWSIDQEQNNLEQKRQIDEDTYQFLLGMYS